ncbi:DMT family transporter [Candidatus Woesearchaeota archaeon]|nr:DMT family transporter [Candidatus Woesearchaeota archaeon]
MDPIIIALISAVFFGITANLIKKAVTKKHHSINAIFTFGTAAIIMWVIVFLVGSSLPSSQATFFFVIAGILAPGFSAFFNFESMKHAGVSITTSLMSSAPLFSTLFAIIFLKEKINSAILIGTLLIIFGAFIISWNRPKKHISLNYILFPIGGAFMIGTGAVFSKQGLILSNLPFAGIAIAITSGVMLHLVYLLYSRKWNVLPKTFDEFKYYILSGITAAIALTLLFVALSLGKVVIIFPLSNTQVLFAILFSWMFMRHHDHISKHTVFGAVSILVGVSLLSLG